MSAWRDVCVALPVGLGTHSSVTPAFCTSESQNEGGRGREARGGIVSFLRDCNPSLYLFAIIDAFECPASSVT